MQIFSLVNAGLIVITLAWFVQLYRVVKVDKNISPVFVFGYMLGVAMLVLDAWLEKVPVSYFELATFVAATIVLIVVLRKK